MTSRERALAVLLVVLIVFGGGGFFSYQFLYKPWTQRTQNLLRLQKEEKEKLARRDELDKQRARLARWTSLSLPGDQETARLEYERYLTQLLNRHKIITGREITPRPIDTKSSPTIGPSKDPIYTKLSFQVKAYATMANLVAMLDEFYRTGLMHEIKNISIQRQSTSKPDVRADELDVRMTIEALIIAGADKRPQLLPNYDRKLLAIDLAPAMFPHGPMVLWTSASPGLSSPGVLADPPRDYANIARKNVFLGRPPRTAPVVGPVVDDGTPMWMAPRFVYLNEITHTPLRWQGTIYDRLHMVNFKIRESGTYTSFPIVRDGRAEHFLDGHVMLIEEGKVYYQLELATPESLGREALVARPDKAEQESLVADKLVSAEDAKRVVRYVETYWDSLLRTKVIKSGFDKNRFTVELERESDSPGDEDSGDPVEVMRGKVILRDDGYVYVLPDERYYELHLGESLDDSFKRKPLPREKIKELKELAAN